MPLAGGSHALNISYKEKGSGECPENAWHKKHFVVKVVVASVDKTQVLSVVKPHENLRHLSSKHPCISWVLHLVCTCTITSPLCCVTLHLMQDLALNAHALSKLQLWLHLLLLWWLSAFSCLFSWLWPSSPSYCCTHVSRHRLTSVCVCGGGGGVTFVMHI